MLKIYPLFDNYNLLSSWNSVPVFICSDNTTGRWLWSKLDQKTRIWDQWTCEVLKKCYQRIIKIVQSKFYTYIFHPTWSQTLLAYSKWGNAYQNTMSNTWFWLSDLEFILFAIQRGFLGSPSNGENWILITHCRLCSLDET